MKHKILTAVVICLISMGSYAQKSKATKAALAKANTGSEKMTSLDPIKTYERIGIKGYKLSADQLKKVGNACYYNNELEKAAKFYTELYAVTQDLEPEFYYRYAQSLKSVKDFKKADEMMALFNQKKT